MAAEFIMWSTTECVCHSVVLSTRLQRLDGRINVKSKMLTTILHCENKPKQIILNTFLYRIPCVVNQRLPDRRSHSAPFKQD